MKLRPINTLEDVENGLCALLDLDPALAAIAEKAGPLPLRRRPADFAGLAHIVVGQLVSVASASAIYGRLEQRVSPLTAEHFIRFSDIDLAGVGLSGSKISTLRAISTACAAGLDLELLAESPAEEAHAELCRIKGIGRWSADVFLLFCAGHPDIFPSGDMALRIAVRDALDLDDKPSIKDLDKRAAAWSPWRGIAARLFWSWYKAQKKGRETLPV